MGYWKWTGKAIIKGLKHPIVIGLSFILGLAIIGLLIAGYFEIPRSFGFMVGAFIGLVIYILFLSYDAYLWEKRWNDKIDD